MVYPSCPRQLALWIKSLLGIQSRDCLTFHVVSSISGIPIGHENARSNYHLWLSCSLSSHPQICSCSSPSSSLTNNLRPLCKFCRKSSAHWSKKKKGKVFHPIKQTPFIFFSPLYVAPLWSSSRNQLHPCGPSFALPLQQTDGREVSRESWFPPST